MAGPLCSACITRLHRSYESVRPCMPRFGTQSLTVLAAWEAPSRFRFGHVTSPRQYRGLRFSRSVLAPDVGLAPPIRRMPSGQQAGFPQTCPEEPGAFGFDIITAALDASSTVHSHSPSQLVPDILLGRLFRNVHHPSHCAGAACGGLEPPPARRPRGTYPHHQHSIASVPPVYI